MGVKVTPKIRRRCAVECRNRMGSGRSISAARTIHR